MDYEDDWGSRFDRWKVRRVNEKESKLKLNRFSEKIEEEFVNVRDEIKNIPYKIEKSLDLKHNPKLKLFLTILAYFIPLLVLALVLSYIFTPFTTARSVKYTVDVATKGDMDKGKPLYLEESKALSPPVQYGEETYREIVKTVPFYINFRSPVRIHDDSKVILSMDFIGKNADLIIDNELRFPSLENYELLKEFNDSYLYKRKDIVKKDSNNENVRDFLINNYYGSSVYSYLPLDLSYDVAGYKNKETIISNTFRGNLNFILYTENGLNLNFEKQDMNWYTGEDNYTVIIKDINEKIVDSYFVEDDGDVSDQRNLGKTKLNIINVLDINGIYYLTFESGGKQTDSTIKNIAVDTNKIMFNKGFLVLDPMSFYVKNSFEKNISFFYWHEDKDQNITINGEDFYIGKEYDGVTYNRLLLNGEYELSIEKGDIVINNNFMAKSKGNWFDIGLLQQQTIDNPEFIVLNKKEIKITDEGFILYKYLTFSDDQRIELISSRKNEFKLRKIEVDIS